MESADPPERGRDVGRVDVGNLGGHRLDVLRRPGWDGVGVRSTADAAATAGTAPGGQLLRRQLREHVPFCRIRRGGEEPVPLRGGKMTGFGRGGAHPRGAVDDGGIHDSGRKVVPVEEAGLPEIQQVEKHVLGRRAVESEPEKPVESCAPVEVGRCRQSGPGTVEDVAGMFVSHRPKIRRSGDRSSG
ncbi:hypothetical protein ACQP2X_21510 [Actinoplanes sp. CA-131856]